MRDGKIVSVSAGAAARGRPRDRRGGPPPLSLPVPADDGARPRGDLAPCGRPWTRARSATSTPTRAASVAVNFDSELLPVARSGGILVAGVTPTGGIISGTVAAMKLDGWTREDATLREPAAVTVFWPSLAIDRSPTARRSVKAQEKKRDEAVAKLKNAFLRRARLREGPRGRGPGWDPEARHGREARGPCAGARRPNPRRGRGRRARADPRRREMGEGREAAPRDLGRSRRLAHGRRAREGRRPGHRGFTARPPAPRGRALRHPVRQCGKAREGRRARDLQRGRRQRHERAQPAAPRGDRGHVRLPAREGGRGHDARAREAARRGRPRSARSRRARTRRSS